MKRTPIFAGASVALGAGLALGTGAFAASEDQARADAGIAAFSEQVTAAGFESAGPSAAGDILRLLPSGDSDDPAAVAASACAGDLSQFLNDDGTFVGETARAASDSFEMAPDEPPSTDPMAIPRYDQIAAVVAIVEDDAVIGVTQILDAFASGELFDCYVEALGTVPPASGEAPPTLSFDEEDLDVGDQGVLVESSTTFSIGDQDMTFAVSLAIARVGNAVAIVTYDSSGEPLSDITAVDALTTIVEELG